MGGSRASYMKNPMTKEQQKGKNNCNSSTEEGGQLIFATERDRRSPTHMCVFERREKKRQTYSLDFAFCYSIIRKNFIEEMMQRMNKKREKERKKQQKIHPNVCSTVYLYAKVCLYI